MLRSTIASSHRPRGASIFGFALGAALLAACSGSGTNDAQQQQRATSTESLKVGQCTADVIGDGKSCLDVGLVKEKAAQSCDVRGLVLGDLSLDDASGKCATTAKVACCKTDPLPSGGDPGKGDPGKGGTGGGATGGGSGGGACTVTSLGSPGACADIGTWKDDAVKTCALQGGAALVEFDVTDVCGKDLFSFVKIECCSPQKDPPPPPPEKCFDAAIGDGKTCLDPAVVKQEVVEKCGVPGLQLQSLDFGPACANGGVLGAKFSCCAVTPPPPPPPTACVGDAIGDGKTCQPDDVLQKQAFASCGTQGLNLGDFFASDDCDKGSSHFAKFTCCKDVTPVPPPDKPPPSDPPPGK